MRDACMFTFLHEGWHAYDYEPRELAAAWAK